MTEKNEQLITFNLLINNNDKWLAINRNGKNSILQPLTGEVKFQESLLQAVKRETKEQISVKIKIAIPLKVEKITKNGTGWSILILAIAENDEAPSQKKMFSSFDVETYKSALGLKNWDLSSIANRLNLWLSGENEIDKLVEIIPLPIYRRKGDYGGDEILRLDEKRTKNEVNFLIDTMRLSKTDRIVAIGCGAGRHLVGLAMDGFKDLMGIDIDTEAIEKAKQELSKIDRSDVVIINKDYRDVDFSCKSAFFYFGVFGFGKGRDYIKDIKILSNKIQPGGKIFLDLISNNFYKNNENNLRYAIDDNGVIVFENNQFNQQTEEVFSERIYIGLFNGFQKWGYALKTFSPKAIETLLNQSGFRILGIYGNEKLVPFNTYQQRLLVVANKI